MPANAVSFDKAPVNAYIDSSFFLNLLIKDSTYHQECRLFAGKLKDARTVLISSALTLDEIYYVLLKVMAIKDYGKKWQTELKEDPDVVKTYAREIQKHIANILEIPNLFFIDNKTSAVLQSLEFIKNHGLFPRDAIHAQVMLVSGENIITTDMDFLRVNSINVYICNPKAFA